MCTKTRNEELFQSMTINVRRRLRTKRLLVRQVFGIGVTNARAGGGGDTQSGLAERGFGNKKSSVREPPPYSATACAVALP